MTMEPDYIPIFVCFPGMDYARMYVEDHSIYMDNPSGNGERVLRSRDVRINAEWTYEFWEEQSHLPALRLVTTELAHVICDQGYMWNLVSPQVDRDIRRRMMVLYAKMTPAMDLRIARPVSTFPAITSKLRRDLHL